MADGARLVGRIDALLAPSGLVCRGILAIGPGEGTDDRLKSGVLVGHLGGAFWPVFAAWHAANPDASDPLDTWSRQVIGAVADTIGGTPVHPGDRPFLPFQRWATRAEGLKPSPLGILMHPVAGLWHAYRGAILFEQSFISEHPAGPVAHACDTCADKPCLNACPVQAISSDRFNVGACRSHLAVVEGEACRASGCRARNACPVGTAHRYSAEQQAFHQRAFAGVNPGEGD